jgi:hypothetical protein
MSVFKPRNRLVNFRLSDEEFDKLKALCPMHGARSISDFARSSVLERLEKVPSQLLETAPLPTRPVDDKVVQLEARVDQLMSLMNAVGFTQTVPLNALAQPPTLSEARLPPEA